MTRDDLPTVGYLEDRFRDILSRLTEPGTALSVVPRLLSIEDVMAECGVSRPTVSRWMHEGKPGRHGGTIRLQYYQFSADKPRIPWPALAAFGQGLPFDLASLDRGVAAPDDKTPLRRAS